jgi:hypothetical protein
VILVRLILIFVAKVTSALRLLIPNVSLSNGEKTFSAEDHWNALFPKYYMVFLSFVCDDIKNYIEVRKTSQGSEGAGMVLLEIDEKITRSFLLVCNFLLRFGHLHTDQQLRKISFILNKAREIIEDQVRKEKMDGASEDDFVEYFPFGKPLYHALVIIGREQRLRSGHLITN